ncbi:hypothetical protein ACA910_008975 [Epithemia clementina (nom. ined.)]
MFMCLSLNNEALRLLSSGQLEPAVVKLRYALALISENNFRCPDWESLIGATAIRRLLPSPFAMELDSRLFSKSQESSPDNLFSVYEKGFAFQEILDNITSDDDNEEEDLTWLLSESQEQFLRQMMANPLLLSKIVRSIVMFNLALATHALGLQSGNSSASFLRHALRLYQISLTTLSGAMSELQHDDECIFLVMLALLANMGHLLSHFWLHQAAMDCLWSMENYRRLPIYGTLHARETKFFNHTVVFGRVACTRFSVAPAA